METLRQRLEEQKGRHQGGSKWIGTAGTSPFGAYGYNPEGIRIGQDRSRNRRAVKVWDQREFRDYDTDRELGVRNIKLALRRLRRFARDGRPRGARPSRHDPLHGAQCRMAGPEDRAGAAQRGEGAPLPRRGRHDGRPHPRRRGALQRRAHRVQESRALLLPQLRLRVGLEGQPAPRTGERDPDRGRDAQVRPRLQGDLRGRRRDEPLRARAARRQRRALERRGGTRVAGADAARLAARRVAQSGAARSTGAGPSPPRTSAASSTGACIR